MASDKHLRWVSIDADAETKPDVVAFVPPLPVPDEKADVIYASHVLEHMTYLVGQDFLKECFRALHPQGEMIVRVPNMRVILTHYVTKVPPPDPPDGWLNIPGIKDWNHYDLDIINHLYIYSTVQSSHHQWPYDQDTLIRAVAAAGFEYVQMIPQLAWWDLGLKARKQRLPGFMQLVREAKPNATAVGVAG